MSPTSPSPLEAAALDALRQVKDPLTERDWVSGKQIRSVSVEGGRASVEITLGYAAQSQWQAWTGLIEQALLPLDGIDAVSVLWRTEVRTHAVSRGQTPMPSVKNSVGVASGKGGVGKSTTAVNLALALAAEGARVGMLDADIYGPSQPLMMGLKERPESPDGKSIEPLSRHGVQMMSIGLLIDEKAPAIWRGPMATQALEQILRQTNWGEDGQPLDYLIVDMPPGTGDIHLTLCQRTPMTAATVVTTPQDIAVLDARKGLTMFEKVSVPVLGVIEHMAVYHCPQCGHTAHIFGEHGGQHLAEATGVPLLGSMPLLLDIRLQADAGDPIVASAPEGEAAQLYRAMARQVAAKLSL